MMDLDQRAESWIVQHRAGWLNPVFEAVTWAGTFGGIFLAPREEEVRQEGGGGKIEMLGLHCPWARMQ